jgi:hypothetical protein
MAADCNHAVPVFRFDRRYEFNAPPDELWSAITRVDAYRDYWPWLRSVQGDGLVAGKVNKVAIWAPVPWMIRLTLVVERVVDGAEADVAVDGDLRGVATLRVSPAANDPSRATARLAWDLTPASPALRVAGRMARPVLQYGQDWVVSMGIGQFRRQGLG